MAGAADRRPGETLLRVDGLAKNYDGITAVDGAELEIAEGEVVDPNEAGKTTTLEMSAGITIPDRGTVHWLGHDATCSGPQYRVRQGLVRSFQEAALFPALTVTETVAIALERSRPARRGRSLLGLELSARSKRQDAESLIGHFGLFAYRPRRNSELSTETRRIVELACLVALQSRLLLLDEPTSGCPSGRPRPLRNCCADCTRTLLSPWWS
ncbi:ATP-binding cassette domain-containing protein [Streptomyces mirabilis]|uniref:ATP-binding cassette domain-containing protein n=1 Tax=Streptomyces mirabilis TaxID=68239 RepID=UPI00332303AB